MMLFTGMCMFLFDVCACVHIHVYVHVEPCQLLVWAQGNFKIWSAWGNEHLTTGTCLKLITLTLNNNYTFRHDITITSVFLFDKPIYFIYLQNYFFILLFSYNICNYLFIQNTCQVGHQSRSRYMMAKNRAYRDVIDDRNHPLNSNTVKPRLTNLIHSRMRFVT